LTKSRSRPFVIVWRDHDLSSIAAFAVSIVGRRAERRVRDVVASLREEFALSTVRVPTSNELPAHPVNGRVASADVRHCVSVENPHHNVRNNFLDCCHRAVRGSTCSNVGDERMTLSSQVPDNG
jgi:hypothetical protein